MVNDNKILEYLDPNMLKTLLNQQTNKKNIIEQNIERLPEFQPTKKRAMRKILSVLLHYLLCLGFIKQNKISSVQQKQARIFVKAIMDLTTS